MKKSMAALIAAGLLSACTTMSETLTGEPRFSYYTERPAMDAVDCISQQLGALDFLGIAMPAPVASRAGGAWQITFGSDTRYITTVRDEPPGSRVEFRAASYVIVPSTIQPAVERCRDLG